MATIKDNDRGYRKLMDRVSKKGIGSRHIVVGIFGSNAEKSHGNLTNVELAAIHEFGAPGAGIPQRSFIRAGVDKKKITIQKTMVRTTRGYVSGKISADLAMQIVGDVALDAIVERINSNIPPALKPRTIARKQSRVALIDTGRLKQSLSYEVRKS